MADLSTELWHDEKNSAQMLQVIFLVFLGLGTISEIFYVLSTGGVYSPFAIIMYVLAVGVGVGWLRAKARASKFGRSTLRYREPAIVGQEFRATLSVEREVHPEGDYLFAIACVETITSGSGKNRKTREHTLWKDTKKVSPRGVTSRGGIPLAFSLPSDALPSEGGDEERSIKWTLNVDAPTHGVNYSADFHLPVFKDIAAAEKYYAEDEADDAEELDEAAGS